MLLLIPGVLFAMPLSMLLIVIGALGTGAAAAAWFARSSRTTSHAGHAVTNHKEIRARIAIAVKGVETDAPPDLAEKLG
jgi:hypothetical protein